MNSSSRWMNVAKLTSAIIDRYQIIIGRSDRTTRKFERFGAWTFCACGCRIHSAGLRWRVTAFENRILTGAVINSRHIEPHQFFEDARKIVLDRVQDVLRKCDAQDKHCV